MLRKIIDIAPPFLDIILIPFVVVSGLIFKFFLKVGCPRLPINTSLLKSLGVFPICDHYYEPLFNDKHLTKSLREERHLPGIDLNLPGQVGFLKLLNYQQEFEDFLSTQKTMEPELRFSITDESFGSGDAEFLYNFVRYLKPKRIIEIGCGTSTKLIAHALANNLAIDGKEYEHVCVEPYEQPWLSKMGKINLVRDKIEDCSIDWRKDLEPGDFLFIDSSHIIRPQGDVLYEYLEIIPQLNSGVHVHVHDIFSPFDYPDEWIRKDVRFWNEQYLLEAVLGSNTRYEIVAALNYLKHTEFSSLKTVCPHLTPEREPGSFYFRVS